MARAIHTWPGTRPYIFTKCGLRWDEQGRIRRVLRADSIRQECEDSLRRLKVDVIDLYQIHWPTQDLGKIKEGWSTMTQLQRQGIVRWIGVSNFSVEQMSRIHPRAPITSLQPPYSLIRRDIEAEILPYCQWENIGVIIYSPMASGLLSGAMTRERAASLPEDDWRCRDPDFIEPNLSKHLKVVSRLQEIGRRYGRLPGEVAIAWTLCHPAVTGAIVGARTAQQVDGVMRVGALRLSPEDIAALTRTA